MRKLKVDYVMEFTKKLGTGPLLTSVYDGSYGLDPNKSVNRDDRSKHELKRILIKKINAKFISAEVDWWRFQRLDHPNVATYIFVREDARLCSSRVFIAQNFCEYTLNHLAQLLSFNWLTGQVIKSAVKDIAEGLNYLHGQTPNPIVHRNLKPSNVLVKPPLALPTGFVLTDFWYTNCKRLPKKSGCCSCCSSAPEEDNPEILRWMAPELISGNNEKSATPMMDMYSFGMILEFLQSQGPLPLDAVDDYLFKLLIQETVRVKPSHRIVSRDIMELHPLLIGSNQRNVKGVAKARLTYIKEGYSRILKLDLNSGREKLRKHVDSKALCIFGSEIYPWNDSAQSTNSFNRTVFQVMTRISQKPFDPNSFLDLIRLIRYCKKFLSAVGGGKYNELLNQVAIDAFSRSYPYVIPLVYICLDCRLDHSFLPLTVFVERTFENSVENLSKSHDSESYRSSSSRMSPPSETSSTWKTSTSWN